MKLLLTTLLLLTSFNVSAAVEYAEQKDVIMQRNKNADTEVLAHSIFELLGSRVSAVWRRPPSARNGMKTKVRINFLPNGHISNVKIIDGSGDALFDKRTLDAIYKVEKMEEVAEVDADIFERYFRQIYLIFNPQDLRH